MIQMVTVFGGIYHGQEFGVQISPTDTDMPERIHVGDFTYLRFDRTFVYLLDDDGDARAPRHPIPLPGLRSKLPPPRHLRSLH